MIVDCSGQSCAMADEWLEKNRKSNELDSFVEWARRVHRIDLSEYVAWFRERNENKMDRFTLLLAYIRENGLPINIAHGTNNEIADWMEETANLLELASKEDE